MRCSIAMEERQVTVDGESWPCPSRILVLGDPEPDRSDGHVSFGGKSDGPLPSRHAPRLPGRDHREKPLCLTGRAMLPRSRPCARRRAWLPPRRPSPTCRGGPPSRAMPSPSCGEPGGPPHPSRCEPTCGNRPSRCRTCTRRDRRPGFVLPDDVKQWPSVCSLTAWSPMPLGRRLRFRDRGSAGDPRAGSFAEALMRRRSRQHRSGGRRGASDGPRQRRASLALPSVPSAGRRHGALVVHVGRRAHASGSGWVQTVAR